MAAIAFKPATATGSAASVGAPLSLEEIHNRLASIKAVQIDLIGREIITKVLDCLGPIGKFHVMRQVMQKKGLEEASSPEEAEPMAMLMTISMMSVKRAMESEKTQFLSDEQAERFQEEALRPVEAAISDSFSEPDEFLEDGTRFHLSEYRPMGFLAETAEEIGLELTVLDVPPKYCVRLKLDKALTQEKSDLVFALTEESDKVEFSRKTFTISELERNFRSGVR